MVRIVQMIQLKTDLGKQPQFGIRKGEEVKLKGITINDLAPSSMNNLDALFSDIDNFGVEGKLTSHSFLLL